MKYCGYCHVCGYRLRKVLDGEEWCPNCKAYKRYRSHGWNILGANACPDEPEGITVRSKVRDRLIFADIGGT